jgi:hypothetical protein
MNRETYLGPALCCNSVHEFLYVEWIDVRGV